MSQEVELKLEFKQIMPLDEIRSRLCVCLALPEFEGRLLRNIYFDNKDLGLNQAKIALRIREKNGRYIQTLKTQGQAIDGLHRRGEWEWPLEESRLNSEVLRRNPAWPAHLELNALKPVFETHFMRYCCALEYSGAHIELALDVGQIIAGAQVRPILEIELELLQGDDSALLELGKMLMQVLPLLPSDISKAERGYRLASAASEA